MLICSEKPPVSSQKSQLTSHITPVSEKYSTQLEYSTQLKVVFGCGARTKKTILNWVVDL